MEISYINKSKLANNNFNDYISSNSEEDTEELLGLQKRKRLTIIGLGTFYIALILLSFVILS